MAETPRSPNRLSKNKMTDRGLPALSSALPGLLQLWNSQTGLGVLTLSGKKVHSCSRHRAISTLGQYITGSRPSPLPAR